ncbi:MAG: protein kinase [Saprospiraceae bacterium]|nr:protein kinase [Saprospiraceae bacterium]
MESDNNHNLTFNNEEIMNIIKQIASGLALLHDKGIIHNDIKPANIVYITDQNDKKSSTSSPILGLV